MLRLYKCKQFQSIKKSIKMNIEPEKISKSNLIAKLRLTGKDAIYEGYQIKSESAIVAINQSAYYEFWIQEYVSHIKIF